MGSHDLHTFRATFDVFGTDHPELDDLTIRAAEPILRDQIALTEEVVTNLLGRLGLEGFVVDWRPGADHPRLPSVSMTVTATALLNEEESEAMHREVVRTVRSALDLLRLPPDIFEPQS